MIKILVLILISSASSFAFACDDKGGTFGQGDYSTEGVGPCYTGVTSCDYSPYPVRQNYSWEQCKAVGGPIAWLNTKG
ncbi:MAG: hypothetical protein ACXWQE_07550, partial [Bdellovibrionales bacterium]